MRLAISGYGRMGAMVRGAALSRGHEVIFVIDPVSSAPEVNACDFSGVGKDIDVVIDFTVPGAVVKNIEEYCRLGWHAVIGTTGWDNDREKVAKMVREAGTGLVWAANFSLGVSLFFHIVEHAARLLNSFEEYDVFLHETHHRHKADSPSGTALALSRLLMENMPRKNEIVTGDRQEAVAPQELHVSASRGGSVPGTHRVVFDGDADTITLEHSARNRSGFAGGALLAAEWIARRSGFYGLEEMMGDIMGGGKND